MIFILSKCAFVNLFKHPRNITLLNDTRVSFGLGLSSKQLNICATNRKFADISLLLLRFRKINVVTSLTVNWKLMWQVSCGGLGQGLHSPTWLYGGKPTETHGPCTLKKHKKNRRELNYFLFILWKVYEIFFTFFRAVRLSLTLLPILIFYPLALISDSCKNTWYKLLLLSLECSGPIFIKLGQWASTRRDLFSEELCSRLQKLQKRNSPHSWFYTSKSFERVFGPNWQNFLLLDNGGEPVGSGCCAQVYKGWIDFDFVMAAEENARSAGTSAFDRYHLEEHENSFSVEVLEMFGIGSLLSTFQTPNCFQEDEKKKVVPVAIKVLHPRMTTTLRRDMYIMKAAANLLTWMFPSLEWISLPECVDDFTMLMKAQVNFCIEAHNLDKFAKNFADVKEVHFPRPFWSLTTSFLLVESYEDGRPMEEYIKNVETRQTNIKIADIGVNALLKMVFDDNFAHGDLHPGNLIIQERAPACCSKVQPWWKFKKKGKTIPELRLVILDCGIVVSLDARGKKLLRQVFRAVANGEGELVAELFLSNSTHQCPDPKSFKEAMRVLVLSALGKTATLTGIEVSSLIAQLFATMIHHKVKMDGCFSSVILAMMVVEGMGRSLDPTINMVDTARPYLFKPMLSSD